MSVPVNQNNNNNQIQDLSFLRVALALASDYETVYVINNCDDSYTEYRTTGEDNDLQFCSRGDNFYEDTIRNCKILVHPEDQEDFLAYFRKERLIQELENGRSGSVNYRLIINDKPYYYALKAIRDIRGDSDIIIIGVQNVDVQVRRRLADEEEKNAYSEIASSLASLYEVIYHIDINTDNYTQYSSSQQYAELGLRIGGCRGDG